MLKGIPAYISLIFIITTLYVILTVLWVFRNSSNNGIRKNLYLIIGLIILWLTLQGYLSWIGVYHPNTDFLPPKIFLFGILPMILIGIWLFFSYKGKNCIDSVSPEKLTYLHLVRIPVELVLFWLYVHSNVPKIMTFEGLNFDILMGLSAPFILYYGYRKRTMAKKWLIGWHTIGMVLLVVIFIIALLSAPFPLQQFAFERPNIALLYFPFVWLPTFIVPIVFIAHLIAIRQLKGNIKLEAQPYLK